MAKIFRWFTKTLSFVYAFQFNVSIHHAHQCRNSLEWRECEGKKIGRNYLNSWSTKDDDRIEFEWNNSECPDAVELRRRHRRQWRWRWKLKNWISSGFVQCRKGKIGNLLHVSMHRISGTRFFWHSMSNADCGMLNTWFYSMLFLCWIRLASIIMLDTKSANECISVRKNKTKKTIIIAHTRTLCSKQKKQWQHNGAHDRTQWPHWARLTHTQLHTVSLNLNAAHEFFHRLCIDAELIKFLGRDRFSRENPFESLAFTLS